MDMVKFKSQLATFLLLLAVTLPLLKGYEDYLVRWCATAYDLGLQLYCQGHTKRSVGYSSALLDCNCALIREISKQIGTNVCLIETVSRSTERSKVKISYSSTFPGCYLAIDSKIQNKYAQMKSLYCPSLFPFTFTLQCYFAVSKHCQGAYTCV